MGWHLQWHRLSFAVWPQTSYADVGGLSSETSFQRHVWVGLTPTTSHCMKKQVQTHKDCQQETKPGISIRYEETRNNT